MSERSAWKSSPQFDDWFVKEATRQGLTPQQYAVSLANAIEEEIRDLAKRNKKILAERDAATQRQAGEAGNTPCLER